MDRIDIDLEVSTLSHDDLLQPAPAESSAVIKARVTAAREIQLARFKSKKRIWCIAQMGSKEIKAFAVIDGFCQAMLQHAIKDLNFSARAYDRMLKDSRTVADLAGSESITMDHLVEAISYGTLYRQLWCRGKIKAEVGPPNNRPSVTTS